MEDVLKRLLEAEVRAEHLVGEAEAQHDQIVHQARDETRAAEVAYEAKIPELRAAHEHKAKERAGQTIAELKRRYDERLREQHAMAEARTAEALDAAITLLLDPGKG